MTTEGYIKFYRSMLTWEWFRDINVRLVFEYILLAANYRDQVWRGRLIRRGQLFTSYATLADWNGLSIQQARTAVSKLKSTGEITVLPTRNGLLINVVNYEKFQAWESVGSTAGNRENNTTVTGDQQGVAQGVNNDLRKKENKNSRTLQGFRLEEESRRRSAMQQKFFYRYCMEDDSCYGSYCDLYRFFDTDVVIAATEDVFAREKIGNPVEYVRAVCGRMVNGR